MLLDPTIVQEFKEIMTISQDRIEVRNEFAERLFELSKGMLTSKMESRKTQTD